MLDNALRPTREWYMLLAGLLTRAVLEGYLTAGWRGSKPAECLLLVGIGIVSRGAASSEVGGRTQVTNEGGDKEVAEGKEGDGGSDDDDDSETFGDEEEFAEFDPDGLPSLAQAVKVLFPSLNVESDVHSASAAGGQSKKGQAEAEYEAEMYERLRRVRYLDIQWLPLLTHICSSMISLIRLQICRPIWKTLRGLIPRSLLNALLSGSAKQSPSGEENPSLRRYVFIALVTICYQFSQPFPVQEEIILVTRNID